MGKFKKKQILFIILLFFAGSLLFYLTQTARGGSYVLYTFAAWEVPVSIKLNCARETEKRVTEKFKLPLMLDKRSKDELKGFWYYSYFRECLHGSGYDFSGNKIKRSYIEGSNEVFIYKNDSAGVYFTVPKESEILSDNILNVDFDDRLLVSSLKSGNSRIDIHTYTKDDKISSFEDLYERFESFSLTDSLDIRKSILEGQKGIKAVFIEQDAKTYGFAVFTPKEHVIQVFGDVSLKGLIDEMFLSLGYFE